jgi:hypothetical protein
LKTTLDEPFCTPVVPFFVTRHSPARTGASAVSANTVSSAPAGAQSDSGAPSVGRTSTSYSIMGQRGALPRFLFLQTT